MSPHYYYELSAQSCTFTPTSYMIFKRTQKREATEGIYYSYI